VVDDDALIRQVTQLLLTKLGFTPVIANDGLEGVAAFREHANTLRAVLLDLTMPGMDGFEAHAEMHRHNAGVPVILMSGFSQKLSKLPPEAIHPAGVLAKPFGVEQLCERLQAVLG
jgi:CheY-like chemotaxis protein